MIFFKQALIQFKKTWKQSILLGIAGSAFILAVSHIPIISTFIISVGILKLQAAAQAIINKEKITNHFNTKNLFSSVIVGVILVPSGILLGSAIGLLQGQQELTMTVPVSMALITIAVLFYFIFSQSLRHNLETGTSIGKSIDFIAINSIKNFTNYLVPGICFSVLIILSELTKGIGLVITLPLLFYTNQFIYEKSEALNEIL
ncbi:MAG: hypothetical protein ACXVCP_06350 [Bdellovibrio sp.]